MLNVITGELAATEGKLYLLGQDITTMPPYNRTHIGLARSFQMTRLFYGLTLFENALLATLGVRPSRYKMLRPARSDGEALGKARRLLESVGLWEKRNDLARALSHGEQRKAELVLALASEPKVLLLDEPTAGLSTAESSDFVKASKTLLKDTTVVMVAHDMDVVFDFADRVAVLYYGRLIAQGLPEEIQNDPVVKQIYLGIEENAADIRIE